MATGRHSYVRFFPSDWMAGTARMTMLQKAAYLEVCVHNWDRAEPMSRALQNMVFSDGDGSKAAILQLVEAGKLKRTKGGGLYSERAMIEARSSLDRHRIAKASGANGAAKRWKTKGKKDSNPIRLVVANQSQNQSQNHIIPSGINARTREDTKPDCVTPETWAAWIDMRKAIKAPATTSIQQRMAKKLQALDAKGWDAEKLLDRSVINCWRDVFEPKESEREQFLKQKPKQPIRIDRW